MLVTEMLGQFRVQRGLEGVFGELVQQAAWLSQAHLSAPSPKLTAARHDPSDQWSPPGHGIDHRIVQRFSRVRHRHHPFTDQARPSHTVLLIVPTGAALPGVMGGGFAWGRLGSLRKFTGATITAFGTEIGGSSSWNIGSDAWSSSEEEHVEMAIVSVAEAAGSTAAELD